MFAMRLIRHSDALLMLETFAFLIRRYGLPDRPIVPSPLKRTPGIETLAFDSARDPDVFAWARGALERILDATAQPSRCLNLVASRTPYPSQPDLLSFDPDRSAEPGHFTSRIVLELAEGILAGFDTEFPLDDFQNAVVRLAACAYLRQGFALSHCLPSMAEELAEYRVPQRFIENALVAGACLGLTLRRQTPEQALATYGTRMTRAVRRKVRPAYRQWASFEPEVKLLRVLPRALPNEIMQPQTATAFTKGLVSQPQRISWT